MLELYLEWNGSNIMQLFKSNVLNNGDIVSPTGSAVSNSVTFVVESQEKMYLLDLSMLSEWDLSVFYADIVQDNQKRKFPCFALKKATKRKSQDIRPRLVLYGSFFAYYGQQFVFDFIAQVFKRDRIKQIARFDLCCDVPVKKAIIDTFNLREPSAVLGWNREKEQNETTYIGNKWSGGVLRVYDKELESFKRDKAWLYPYIVGIDWVRIECEINARRSEYQEFQVLEDFLIDWKVDFEKMWRFYMAFVSSRNSYFLSIWEQYNKDILTHIYKPVFDSSLMVYRSIDDLPSQYVAQAVGYLKRVYSVCGFTGLLDLIFLASRETLKDKNTFFVRFGRSLREYIPLDNWKGIW